MMAFRVPDWTRWSGEPPDQSTTAVASSVDNSMIESFWSTMQGELLDTRHWMSKAELASAIFE
jgi:transposase InsO family protein